MTWLTRLRISARNFQVVSSSLQCLSGLRRLRDLEIVDMQPPGSRTGLATAPPLSYCTALTRLEILYLPTEVHTKKCLLSRCMVPSLQTTPCKPQLQLHILHHASYGVLKVCGWRCTYLQALLPCIAQLSGLPLRELLLDFQSFSHSAAFLALCQRLPRTLRQLALRSTESRRFGAVAERAPLPPGSLPARVQTTALRQARLHDMPAGVGALTDLHEHTAVRESRKHCRSLFWYHLEHAHTFPHPISRTSLSHATVD